MDLYQEIILDHFKYPRNEGLLDKPDIFAEDLNPLCGDKVNINLKVDETGKILQMGFVGEGCAISKASTSILSEDIIGKNIDEIELMPDAKIYEMIHVEVSPARVKCALLGLSTIKKAIKIYKVSKNNEQG